MNQVLQFAAAVLGFFLGTLLFSRVGMWIAGIFEAIGVQGANGNARSARVLIAGLLHSGPWLLAAVLYWAYHVLSGPDIAAWGWFCGGVAGAVPVWIVVTVYLHLRGKRTAVKNGKHAV